MSSAQRNLQSLDETANEPDAISSGSVARIRGQKASREALDSLRSSNRDAITSEPFSLSEPLPLKEQVARRLAAHRARRSQGAMDENDAQPVRNATHSRIAAAVAERYAKQQSYHAFLAAEAERTIREAEAAAEIAAINAQAIADAQLQLLETLDAAADEDFHLTAPAPLALVPNQAATQAAPRAGRAGRSTSESREHAALPLEQDFVFSAPPDLDAGSDFVSHASTATPALTVRMAEDLPRPMSETLPYSNRTIAEYERPVAEGDPAHLEALDEEIDFRRAPVFEHVTPPTDIPANLIEFPRQLVAARKARPRLAEGPLREDVASHSDTNSSQLRIFEVEADQISPAPPVAAVEPEWTSILLTSHPAATRVEFVESEAAPQFVPAPAPQAAPLGLRMMAGVVDGVVVGFGVLAFVATAAVTVSHVAPTMTFSLATLGVTSAVSFFVLMMLYQVLFFTFAEATPGMRYARIGLCTLDDNNPTRSAMRRRIFATLLAVCTLGIGYLWALLDEDGLAWHDRLSKMYQRAY